MTELVGKRIKVDDYYGTIRFHGEVGTTGKVWLGIEWDDASRGKHSGTHKGTQYFQTSVPNAGSFITYAPEKLFIEQSFIDALKEKYLNRDCAVNSVKRTTFGDTKIAVEMFGFDDIAERQRKVDNLIEIGLAEYMISEVGEEKFVLPNVTDVDLSKNLITNWSTVIKICNLMPKLKSLWLNANSFSPLPTVDPPESNQSISILSLQNTNLTFDQIVLVSNLFPNLKELHLGFNKIADIPSFDTMLNLSNITTLNLESNGIQNWSKLFSIASLPRLENLYLQNNHLRQIEYRSGDFPSLRFLNITGNEFSLVSSISALSKFPKLEDLKYLQPFITNPFPWKKDKEKDIHRTVLISIIPRLLMFNGTVISSQDRKDCEIWYLHVCEEGIQYNGLCPSDLVGYDRLIEGYGKPRIGKDNSEGTLKSSLVIVNFICPNGKLFTKKLPKSTTIKTLKTLIMRLEKIPFAKQVLQIKSGGVCIKDSDLVETRDLGYYNVSGEAEILVDIIEG